MLSPIFVHTYWSPPTMACSLWSRQSCAARVRQSPMRWCLEFPPRHIPCPWTYCSRFHRRSQASWTIRKTHRLAPHKAALYDSTAFFPLTVLPLIRYTCVLLPNNHPVHEPWKAAEKLCICLTHGMACCLLHNVAGYRWPVNDVLIGIPKHKLKYL